MTMNLTQSQLVGYLDMGILMVSPLESGEHLLPLTELDLMAS